MRASGCPPLVDPVVGAAVVEREEDQRQEEGDHERGQVLVPQDVVGVQVEVAHRQVVLGGLQMQWTHTQFWAQNDLLILCHTSYGIV